MAGRLTVNQFPKGTGSSILPRGTKEINNVEKTNSNRGNGILVDLFGDINS